jgi:hypothetical protein
MASDGWMDCISEMFIPPDPKGHTYLTLVRKEIGEKKERDR